MQVNMLARCSLILQQTAQFNGFTASLHYLLPSAHECALGIHNANNSTGTNVECFNPALRCPPLTAEPPHR